MRFILWARGEDNPPSPSSKNSFPHNIAAVIAKGGNNNNGNKNNGKEVVANLENCEISKTMDHWNGQMPQVKIQALLRNLALTMIIGNIYW